MMAVFRSFSLILLLLSALPAGADSATQAVVKSPLLWRIDGKVPVYLFGTIHIPDPRATTLHPSVEQAFADSDMVLTELKMDMDTMTAASKAMLLPDKQSLSALLGAGQRQQLETELKAIKPQLKLVLFDRLKPWALATQLVLLPLQQKYPGVPTLDQQLAQRAEQLGKQTEGLEKLDEQLGIFDSLSQADQLSFLQDAIDGVAEARRTGNNLVELLVDAWLSGDESRVAALLDEFQGSNNELNARLAKALIDDRNQTMSQRLHARIKAKPNTRYFVAIGAAHLIGDKSVVALLRRQGYTVTRIQ